ncbi:peptidylprolyl isomerase [Novosphingobium sp. ERW19]|jgi:peptidyl-prolyl cis-trans isomerase SurA|uniref:peptidylprolyl isomerase n=1 Tax=Novosphingobium sp. ERW19 TaxID=2726186 RepID=UPI0011D9F846|nr:peptidylprolyl isomerase [Novosphingobium sp. ERW19]MBA4087418.1 peptidylprolyl isomerase [Novosphingobium sp.]NLR37824.1 peptidylprolyl isomerase [Novosphingobium sp. ERW19]TXI08740.1 MAG: peptidylprolyl isomerase [Novosphingobium sp.]
MTSKLKITRKAVSRTLGSTAMALGALSIAASPVLAQGANAPLNIPANPTMFGTNDPNVRRATAIINGEIVTGTDVEQRLALIVSANGGKISAEETERLRMQVLRNLIDETLQIQEAKAADVPADDAQVESTYERVATQNFGQSPEAMEKYLARIGSSAASLKRQIRGEIAWQNLLRRNVQPFVNISEGEVQEAIQRLQASKGTDEYRIGEIFLAATDENKAQVFANAEKIVEQLKQGGSFVAYARQYSEASTASVGGDLGWIRLGQLPTELATAAGSMAPGQLAGPVEIRGGFSILYLIDKRQVLTADPRDALLSLKQISIEFAKGTSNDQATKRAAEFAATVKAIKGCGDAEVQATKIGATVVANDQIKARDLPAQLQDTLLNLQVGQTTPPFGSIDEGVRVLMLCGRDDPQVASGPNFDEMMAQMEDDRVNKRAQTYLRDLRRDAVIEYN